MGNQYVITKGEIQAMTAGTGIAHSEFNDSHDRPANFLQIWVLPREKNVPPSYSQKKFDPVKREDCFQLIVSPDGRNESVQINQNAYFSLVDFKDNKILSYKKYLKENGVYFFLIKGSLIIGEEKLKEKDGLGVRGQDSIDIKGESGAELLIMEVPMA